MSNSRTKGWATIGLAMIIVAGAIYALAIALGVGAAIYQAAKEFGAPVLAVLALPALAGAGMLILVAKVIVDHLTSEEDQYYSKHIDE